MNPLKTRWISVKQAFPKPMIGIMFGFDGPIRPIVFIVFGRWALILGPHVDTGKKEA